MRLHGRVSKALGASGPTVCKDSGLRFVVTTLQRYVSRVFEGSFHKP